MWNAAGQAPSRVAADYCRFQLLTGCRGVEIHGHKKLGYAPLKVGDAVFMPSASATASPLNSDRHRLVVSRPVVSRRVRITDHAHLPSSLLDLAAT